MAEETNGLFSKVVGKMGEAGAALVGGAAGIGGELGQYASEGLEGITSGDIFKPSTYRQFAQGVKDIRSGKVNIAKQGIGKEVGMARTFQGLFGPEGARGPVDVEKSTAEETKLKNSPLYDATKRDLLNTGEGLVDLAGLFVGFGEEKKKEAEAALKEKNLPTDKYTKALVAGAKTGQELAGGMLSSGLVLANAFGGDEGQKLYREAPITTLMNALPIISGTLKLFKAGRLSKVRAAEFEKAVAQRGYASVDAFEQAVKDAEGKIKSLKGEPTTTELTPDQQAQLAEAEDVVKQKASAIAQSVREAAKPKVSGPAPISRAAAGVTGLGERIIHKLPYVAAVGALSPPAGIAVGAGLALGEATGLMNKFFPTSAPAKATKKLAGKFKRAVVEPRTYETPEAGQYSEQLLGAEGDIKALETKLSSVAEPIGAAEITEVPQFEGGKPSEQLAQEAADFDSKFRLSKEDWNKKLEAILEEKRQARMAALQNEQPILKQEKTDALKLNRKEWKDAKVAAVDEYTKLEELKTVLKQIDDITTKTEKSGGKIPSSLANKRAQLQATADAIQSQLNKMEQLYSDKAEEIKQAHFEAVEDIKKRYPTQLPEAQQLELVQELVELENERDAGKRKLLRDELAKRYDWYQEVEKRFPEQSRAELTPSQNLIVGKQAVGVEPSVQPSKQVAVDLENPNTAALYNQFKEQTKGTFLEGNETAQRQAFTALAVFPKIKVLWLLDDGLRTKVAERLLKATKAAGNPTVIAALSEQLKNIANSAFDKTANGIPSIPQISIREAVESPVVQRALTQAGEIGLPSDLGGRSIDSAIVNVADETGFKPAQVGLSEVLKHQQKSLIGEMTAEASQGIPQTIDGIQKAFRNKLNIDAIAAVPFDPTELIAKLRKEAAEPSRTKNFLGASPRETAAYQRFATRLADKLETLKEKRAGAFTTGDVQNVKFYQDTIDAANKSGFWDKLPGGIKRLTTVYNPVVLIGNYLGNAIVESLSTGKDPITSLTSQVATGLEVANRLEKAKKTGNLSLQDELTLRAVPGLETRMIAEGSQDVYGIEKKQPLKAVQGAYGFGDTGPKLTEANTQAGNLLNRLENAPDKSTFTVNTGPGQTVLIQKNGPQYTIINPENGNILTTGDINSPKVKRVLAAAVKEMVDRKFPDVSQLPSWYKSIASGGQSFAGKAASLVVFSPFMSYVLKAADSPWRKGILSNLIEGTQDSPILHESQAGEKPTPKNYKQQVFDNLLDNNVGNYLKSRGLVNSMAARYNNLSAEERQMLRELYAFSPAQVKPLIFGQLMNLENGYQAINTSSPSYANFWSLSDTYIRAAASLGKYVPMGKNPKKDLLEVTDAEKQPVLDDYMFQAVEGKQPTLTDAARAAGVAGGLFLPIFLKVIEEEKLGKGPLEARDMFKTLGWLGKALDWAATESGYIDENVSTGKPIEIGGFNKTIDMIVGTQLSSPTIPAKKVEQLMKGTYQEVWNNLINPMINKAALLEAQGDYDGSDQLYARAEDINDALQERLINRTDVYISTLAKLGIEMEVNKKAYGFRKIREQELPVIQREQSQPEPEMLDTTTPVRPYGGMPQQQEEE